MILMWSLRQIQDKIKNPSQSPNIKIQDKSNPKSKKQKSNTNPRQIPKIKNPIQIQDKVQNQRQIQDKVQI